MEMSKGALARGIVAAADLKAGTWASVEALAILAAEAQDPAILLRAQGAADGLKGAGS